MSDQRWSAYWSVKKSFLKQNVAMGRLLSNGNTQTLSAPGIQGNSGGRLARSNEFRHGYRSGRNRVASGQKKSVEAMGS